MRTKRPITKKDVKKMMELRQKGLSYREIGDIMKYSQMTPYRYLKVIHR